MRVFVSEYVSSGAWPDAEPPASLAREGLSMLSAVLADFARIDDCRVVTTCDLRAAEALAHDPIMRDRVNVYPVTRPTEELRIFEQFAGESDATLVIAPEFDGILASRCRTAVRAGARLLGPSPQAVELCADKLALYRHLQQFPIIPTIPTELVADAMGADGEIDIPFPVVVKPRYGAGSLDVQRIDSAREWQDFIADSRNVNERIVQPWIEGRALSVSAIVRADGTTFHLFPAGAQHLSDDGRFQYQGGHVPADRVKHHRVHQAVLPGLVKVPGLSGYVGLDLIERDDEDRTVALCEINPRLTTSYLGYRQLANVNLAEQMLYPDKEWVNITWKPGRVSFGPDGNFELTERR